MCSLYELCSGGEIKVFALEDEEAGGVGKDWQVRWTPGSVGSGEETLASSAHIGSELTAWLRRKVVISTPD